MKFLKMGRASHPPPYPVAEPALDVEDELNDDKNSTDDYMDSK